MHLSKHSLISQSASGPVQVIVRVLHRQAFKRLCWHQCMHEAAKLNYLSIHGTEIGATKQNKKNLLIVNGFGFDV